MKLAEIEGELGNLSAEELRQLAVVSWKAFLSRTGQTDPERGCDELDDDLLRALDDAISEADASPGVGCSGPDVRRQLSEWITRSSLGKRS